MRTKSNFPKKREEIIRIALELFLAHGYENTNITMIMKAAQLSKGGMYHYFSSKEEILDGVIRYAQQEERAAFEEGLADAPTVTDKLLFFIKGDVLIRSDYREQFTAFKQKQRNSIVTYRIKELNAEFGVPYLQQIIRAGIEEGLYQTQHPDELAWMLFDAGQRLFYRMVYVVEEGEDEYEIDEVAAAFLELIQRALCVSDPEANLAFEEGLMSELTGSTFDWNDIDIGWRTKSNE